MVEKGLIYERTEWKKIVWKRAWSLEDTFWRIERNEMQRSLDILCVVLPIP